MLIQDQPFENLEDERQWLKEKWTSGQVVLGIDEMDDIMAKRCIIQLLDSFRQKYPNWQLATEDSSNDALANNKEKDEE